MATIQSLKDKVTTNETQQNPLDRITGLEVRDVDTSIIEELAERGIKYLTDTNQLATLANVEAKFAYVKDYGLFADTDSGVADNITIFQGVGLRFWTLIGKKPIAALTNTVPGHVIATLQDSYGTVTDINESVTNITDAYLQGTTIHIKYLSEDGNEYENTIDISSAFVDIHVANASLDPNSYILTITDTDNNTHQVNLSDLLKISTQDNGFEIQLAGDGSPANPLTAKLKQQGATDGQVLIWSNAQGKWIPSNASSNSSFAQVLAVGNISTAGTASTPPFKFPTSSVLTTTPQPGAVEYDGVSMYITDNNGVRQDVVQTNRVFKVYSRDYNTGTQDGAAYGPYTLIGWDAQYVNDPTYAPAIACLMNIEITLSGASAGQYISVEFQGTEVYRLNIPNGVSTAYVIGTVLINQDIKYPDMWYVKGAVESIDSSATITSSVNKAFRLYPQSFTNPTLKLISNGGWSRIGANYTIDKKQQGQWIY